MEWLKEWAVPLSAGATFILAIAAFWAIRQTHRIRKSEKRERLLDELVEWASKIVHLHYEKSDFDIANLPKDVDDEFGIKIKLNLLMAWRTSLQTLYYEAQELKPVVKAFSRKHPELRNVTKQVLEEIMEHDKILHSIGDIIDKQSNEIAQVEIQLNDGLLQNNDKFLKEAGKVLHKEEDFWQRFNVVLLKHRNKLAEEANKLIRIAIDIKCNP